LSDSCRMLLPAIAALCVWEVIREGHINTVNERTDSGSRYLSDKQMRFTRNTAYFGRTFLRFNLHQNNKRCLCVELNSYGDSDEIIFKGRELLHIFCLPNMYYSEVECVDCVILTSVS